LEHLFFHPCRAKIQCSVNINGTLEIKFVIRNAPSRFNVGFTNNFANRRAETKAMPPLPLDEAIFKYRGGSRIFRRGSRSRWGPF
jgi:hypothetical protein